MTPVSRPETVQTRGVTPKSGDATRSIQPATATGYFFSGSEAGGTTTTVLPDLPGAPSGPGAPGGPAGPGTATGGGTTTGGGADGVGCTTVFSHALNPNAATSAAANIEYFITVPILKVVRVAKVV